MELPVSSEVALSTQAETAKATELPETSRLYLVGLHQNEDVVHPDSQHQERDDFNDDEGQGHPRVAEDAQGAGHRAQHDQDPRDAQGDFRIHLMSGKSTDQQRAFWPTRYRTLSFKC